MLKRMLKNRKCYTRLRREYRKKVSQIKFTLICCFWVNFPPQTCMLCLLWSNFFSSQNKIIISQQQPSIGPNGIHFRLVRCVFFAVVVRLECRIQNMPQITHANPLFFHFSSSYRIKRQKDAISPQRSVLCACSGLSRDTFKREKDNGLENCAKIHILLWNQKIFLHADHFFRQKMPFMFIFTFSGYTFAYYINLFWFWDLRKLILETIEQIEVNYIRIYSDSVVLFVCFHNIGLALSICFINSIAITCWIK